MYGPVKKPDKLQQVLQSEIQGLLAGSVSKALGDSGLEAMSQVAQQQQSRVVKPSHPPVILPEQGEQWVHKPVFSMNIGQHLKFEISKDQAGVWVKASIGYGEPGKVVWIHEFLHCNDAEPKIFRLYSRNSDRQVSMLEVAKRHRMFPLGCDVRLSK